MVAAQPSIVMHYTVFLFEMNAFVLHLSHHESHILVFTDIIIKDMRFVSMKKKKSS